MGMDTGKRAREASLVRNMHLVEEVLLYHDRDGWAASWSAGGTWDHPTPGDALRVVADALDAEHDDGAQDRA